MDLHIFCQIASQSRATYYVLLAIPQFARHVRASKYEFTHQFKYKRVKKNGTIKYMAGNKLHRDNDLPAIETHGGKEWYKYGVLHRDDDKPARIYYGYWSDGLYIPGFKHYYNKGTKYKPIRHKIKKSITFHGLKI